MTVMATHCQGHFLQKTIFADFLKSYGKLICSKINDQECVRATLILNNLHQRTTQRVKWSSGARITIISVPSLDRTSSIARSLARSIARSRSLVRSFARSLARSIARSIARSLARSLDRSINDRSINDRSINDRLIARSLDRSIVRSMARSIARSVTGFE